MRRIQIAAALALLLSGGLASNSTANPGDCWFASSIEGTVFKLDGNGAKMLDVNASWTPHALSVNPLNGDCWIGSFDGVYKYSDGLLSKASAVSNSTSLSVDPLTGNCWVGTRRDKIETIILNDSLQQIGSRIESETAEKVSFISANPVDGSAWLAVKEDSNRWPGYQYMILKVDQYGNTQAEAGPYGTIGDIEVRPSDGSCLISERLTDEVIKLDENGEELFRIGGLQNPRKITVDAFDGSFWVDEVDGNYLTDHYISKFAANGALEFRMQIGPYGPGVNPVDGSVWFFQDGNMVRLNSDGQELFRVPSIVDYPFSMGVDSGQLDLGFSAIEHINSNNRLWADDGMVDLKPNSRVGQRAQWVITHLGNGYARVVNRMTGELLRATNDGSGVSMDSIQSGKAQWEVIDAGNGEIMLKNKKFGSYLRGHDTRGLSLVQTENPGPNFRWLTTDHQ